MSAFKNNDPLGYIDDLTEALASSNWQALFPRNALPGSDAARWQSASQVAERNPEFPEDAFAIVSSLGFCRLYGITLPDDTEQILSSPLTAEVLVPAIIQSLQLLQSATEEARALPDRFDSAEPLEDRSYCTSLLHQLMELWGAFIVIDDEYQHYLCAEQSMDSPFAVWMRRLLDAFNGLDDELQRDEQVQLLSIATELPLMENWRKMLVPPFRDSLPWWLDGTLEEAADATRRLITADCSTPVERRAPSAVAKDVPYVLAAGSAEPSHAVIDRLASVSTEGVSAADYRRAWAHFLASTYRGTSCRDDWRNVFVELTSSESSMDSLWIQRAEKARALTEDRDWKRRYEGEKVFALEPVPLQDVTEFVKLLTDLVGPEAAD